MNQNLLSAYIQMLPRLQAEERLSQHAVVSIATGNQKQAKAKEMLRDWKKLARPKRAPKRRPQSEAEARTVMAAMGIKVVKHE